MDNFLDFKYNYNIDSIPIKKIESIWRNSYQYKAYIANIFDLFPTLTYKNFENINFQDNNLNKVSLELHHHIPLFDLTMIAAMYTININKEVTMWDIINEVEYMHFNDLIPVVILPKTLHELYHAGKYIYKNTDQGFHTGKIYDFINRYHDCLSKEDINKVEYISPGIKYYYEITYEATYGTKKK